MRQVALALVARGRAGKFTNLSKADAAIANVDIRCGSKAGVGAARNALALPSQADISCDTDGELNILVVASARSKAISAAKCFKIRFLCVPIRTPARRPTASSPFPALNTGSNDGFRSGEKSISRYWFFKARGYNQLYLLT